MLAGCVIACLPAGCARYQPRPLSAERSADALAARTLEAEGLRDFISANLAKPPPEWPPAAWNLELLTLAAYYFHPDLEVARSQWAVARAGLVTAGQRPNPVLSASPALNSTTATPSPWLVTVTLDVPIETAGKRRHRQAQATERAEAARLAIASVAWSVRRDVRSALVAFGMARESLALQRRQTALAAELLTLVEAQRAAGAVSALEESRVRLVAQNARLALYDAERAAVVGRVQLARAIGAPATALDVEISTDGLDRLPDEAEVAGARRQALLHRADIRGALAEYAAEEAALRLEVARQYPDLHLNPGYEFDQGDDKWALGLSIELPVLNQNQGPIAEAEARRIESAARFEALQARVSADVEQAVVAYRTAQETLAETQALGSALRHQEELATATFEAGGISRVELLGLQQQVSASEQAGLEALGRVEQALGEVEDAVRGPASLPEALWQSPARLSAAEDSVSEVDDVAGEKE